MLDHIDQVADIIFSQIRCSADGVATLVLRTAQDGKPERCAGGAAAPLLNHRAHLWPTLKRRLRALLMAKGQRAKQALRANHHAPAPIGPEAT